MRSRRILGPDGRPWDGDVESAAHAAYLISRGYHLPAWMRARFAAGQVLTDNGLNVAPSYQNAPTPSASSQSTLGTTKLTTPALVPVSLDPRVWPANGVRSRGGWGANVAGGGAGHNPWHDVASYMGLAQGLGGGGGVNFYSGNRRYVECTINAAVGDWAGVAFGNGAIAEFGRVGQRPYGAVLIRTGASLTDMRWWAACHSDLAIASQAAQDTIGTNDGFGLRFSQGVSANWTLESRTGGGAQNSVDSGIAVATDTDYLVEWTAQSGRVDIWINGSIVTSTTSIPGATTNLPAVIFYSAANKAALATKVSRGAGGYYEEG